MDIRFIALIAIPFAFAVPPTENPESQEQISLQTVNQGMPWYQFEPRLETLESLDEYPVEDWENPDFTLENEFNRDSNQQYGDPIFIDTSDSESDGEVQEFLRSVEMNASQEQETLAPGDWNQTYIEADALRLFPEGFDVKTGRLHGMDDLPDDGYHRIHNELPMPPKTP